MVKKTKLYNAFIDEDTLLRISTRHPLSAILFSFYAMFVGNVSGTMIISWVGYNFDNRVTLILSIIGFSILAFALFCSIFFLYSSIKAKIFKKAVFPVLIVLTSLLITYLFLILPAYMVEVIKTESGYRLESGAIFAYFVFYVPLISFHFGFFIYNIFRHVSMFKKALEE